MIIIVLFLLGIVGGAAIVYTILHPKVKATRILDIETKEKNDKLRADMLYLENQCANYTTQK
jgi:hypothetical protein